MTYNDFTRHLAIFIATGFGIGRAVKIGQGTIAAVLALIFMPWFISVPYWWQAIFVFTVLAIGTWASNAAEKDFQTKDDHRIVIDEIASVFVMFMFFTPAIISPFWFMLAIGLNRVLDIKKPFGINSLQKLPGGWGIMADDLAVGAVANLILQIAFKFF